MKKNEFNETAAMFNNFMNNSQEAMKNMKDENGNPDPNGEQMMNALNIPMMMAKMMGGKK